jgi:hypothetical protein
MLNNECHKYGLFTQLNALQHTKAKGKGKVIPVLFLTEHHTMKACWGMEV